MKLTVNGEPYELPGASASAEDLIRHMGLDRQAVALELNRKLIRKPDRKQTPLTEGDSVEVVTLVGGG